MLMEYHVKHVMLQCVDLVRNGPNGVAARIHVVVASGNGIVVSIGLADNELARRNVLRKQKTAMSINVLFQSMVIAHVTQLYLPMTVRPLSLLRQLVELMKAELTEFAGPTVALLPKT